MGLLFVGIARSAVLRVASTPMLAEAIAARTGRLASVIAEPFEGAKAAARWAPGANRMNLLWFGHWANLDTIEKAVPALLDYGAKHPLALTVVTIAQTDLLRRFKQFNQHHRHRLSLRYVAWSLEATWRELGATDIVVIPQNMSERTRIAKSPNRLIESIWAGRFVVASPIPSYAEFGEWAALHEDICEGLDWALAHEDAVVPRIKAGQDYIATHYSPSVIADRWEDALVLRS